jgi:hypothetical protein
MHGLFLLFISVVVQVLCSYSTLPLYAIVSHVSSRTHAYMIMFTSVRQCVCVCVSHSNSNNKHLYV